MAKVTAQTLDAQTKATQSPTPRLPDPQALQLPYPEAQGTTDDAVLDGETDCEDELLN